LSPIQINTTQHVALSYEPAGIGNRMLAALLDRFFVYTYFFLISYIFEKFIISHNYYSEDYEKAQNYNAVMYGIMILLLIPAMLYNLLCETFMNGQTFGKKILKIKVVKIDGTQPGFGSYLIRSMLRLIDLTVLSPVVAIVTIAVSEKSQRLGDMAAGTTVIKLNKPLSLKDTILYKQDDTYTLVFEQVALLEDKDATLIKEVIEFSIQQNKPEHIKKLAQKIKDKLGIENTSLKDLEFLKTILKDYSHYQFEK
jgi:uncharacterized RDD family membrane protein YckC